MLLEQLTLIAESSCFMADPVFPHLLLFDEASHPTPSSRLNSETSEIMSAPSELLKTSWAEITSAWLVKITPSTFLVSRSPRTLALLLRDQTHVPSTLLRSCDRIKKAYRILSSPCICSSKIICGGAISPLTGPPGSKDEFTVTLMANHNLWSPSRRLQVVWISSNRLNLAQPAPPFSER